MWGSILGAASGVIGSIFGGNKAKEAADKQKAIIAQQKAKNEAWYNRRYNENYMETSEAQSLLNRSREEAERQVREAIARSRVGGGTAEEVAAAMDRGNDAQASIAGNLASQGTSIKRGVENQYLNRDSSLSQAEQNIYAQEANANTQAANQAMQAGMGLVSADAQTYAKTGRGLFENMFKAKTPK